MRLQQVYFWFLLMDEPFYVAVTVYAAPYLDGYERGGLQRAQRSGSERVGSSWLVSWGVCFRENNGVRDSLERATLAIGIGSPSPSLRDAGIF